MDISNPYLAGLDLAKQHHGTSGQSAMVKCILSLYNSRNSFSISEILAPLDDKYSAAVFAMLHEYARHGETEELRIAGRWCVENFPRMIELADAMSNAAGEVRYRWDREHEAEMRRLYPDG